MQLTTRLLVSSILSHSHLVQLSFPLRRAVLYAQKHLSNSMEGLPTDFPFSNFENNYDPNSCLQPRPHPLTTLDCFLWDQQNCFSSQESLFNSEVANHTSIPLFHDHPNDVAFTGFPSRFGIDNVQGFSNHLSSFQQETGGFVNFQDVDSDSSLVLGKKESKIGSSSTIPWIKGQWTLEEDRKLVELVEKYGYRKWAVVAQHMVGRIGKQCRERWQNHLRPDIKKDHYWSEEEERRLIEAHQRVGNKWAEIAKFIPGRTENSIKNHWNATKRKQTSKRKIKKPAHALNGMKQSVLLEEYIRKLYFNKGNSSSTTSNDNDVNAPPPDDDTPISYLSYEDYEDEKNFMTNLFPDKDIIGTSSKNATGVEMPNGIVGDNYLASSSIMPNMEQNALAIGIPREETLNAFLYPDFFFGSSAFDGSFGSSQ